MTHPPDIGVLLGTEFPPPAAELSPSLRVAEIGPGLSPAVVHIDRALSFRIGYVAINPPWQDAYGGLQERLYTQLGIKELIASFTDLSAIASESFDRLIMRSIFGDPETSGDISSGIPGAFRILDEAGQIVIAEENTPQVVNWMDLNMSLLRAGFDDMQIFPCQDTQNSLWRAYRGGYWNVKKDPPIDSHRAYMVTAKKHQNHTPRHTYGGIIRVEGSEGISQEVGGYDIVGLIEADLPIMIVTKDCMLSLANYLLDRVKAPTTPPLLPVPRPYALPGKQLRSRLVAL